MKSLNLAVVGKDVSKSQSPQIQCFLAKKLGYNVDYKKISVAEGEFVSLTEKLFNEFDGFNVTIPYKLSIIPYLNKVEGDAGVFGAVNTVKTATKTGYNTDGLGFELMLKNDGVDVNGKNVLVLGAGGAGRSAVKKLTDNGARVTLYNRSFEKAQAVANEFKGVICAGQLQNKPYYAIVNATGVGMHETVGFSPVSEQLISLCEVAVDLIYEPAQTRFLQIAEGFNKKTVNGLAMLFYQAYYSACIFADLPADVKQAEILFEEYKREQL